MEEGYCDAMIMAAAGLQRLELDQYITEILEPRITSYNVCYTKLLRKLD